jgi:hypothetical protein
MDPGKLGLELVFGFLKRSNSVWLPESHLSDLLDIWIGVVSF